MSNLRKTMNIDSQKLRKARRILGAKNDTDAVDRALAMVVAQEEIQKAIAAFVERMPELDVQ